jgi:LysM repeat protein
MRPSALLLLPLALVCALSGCASAPTAESPAAAAAVQKPSVPLPVMLRANDQLAALNIAAPPGQSAAPATGQAGAPAKYVVQSGDTLSGIAAQYGLSSVDLVKANRLDNPDALSVGQELIIPGQTAVPAVTPGNGTPAAEVTPTPVGESTDDQPTAEPKRGSVYERLTFAAQAAPVESPYHNMIWLTYYGRPNVPIMGILGEYSIDDLLPRLRQQAAAYDEANGPQLGVMPAFHLIYGMATVYSDDGSYLSYLTDEETQMYIDRAQKEHIGVFLDVQIGGLTPLAAITPAFKWLKYDNVHLAIDPEFAMSEPGQTVPGQPPGTVTAEQVNEVQAALSTYLEENGIRGHRILIVHQFLPWMIANKSDLARYRGVDLTVCADGFGDPPTKVAKYNDFMDDSVPFAGYKLFYQWDEPLMTERQTLGIDESLGIGYMQVTPNLIIYQ